MSLETFGFPVLDGNEKTQWVGLKLRNLINVVNDRFDFKHLSLSSNINEGFVELREMRKKKLGNGGE